MANQEHLQILRQGVAEWNAWRGRQHRDIMPNLSEANLSRAYLSGANLSGADLSRASLMDTSLSRADLRSADLREADFRGVALAGAHLKDADLRGADFRDADFRGADLTGADLSAVILFDTVFGDTNLAAVQGLETCHHLGPSTLDHRTLAWSGLLPLAFLRGCGLPDALIDYLPSLLSEPVQFYSCFISYASKDHAVAERLYADLQNKGVRCWFAPEDMKIGDRLRPRIDETIRLYDKLLLVLSKTSVASQWVEQEVETALARERQQGTTILFPVRIDNTVMTLETGWPALIRNTRNIGDFCAGRRMTYISRPSTGCCGTSKTRRGSRKVHDRLVDIGRVLGIKRGGGYRNRSESESNVIRKL
jgi:uncharacterized protein YjbI with pentapeptide repeats